MIVVVVTPKFPQALFEPWPQVNAIRFRVERMMTLSLILLLEFSQKTAYNLHHTNANV